jgi:molecular chaperone GrpE
MLAVVDNLELAIKASSEHVNSQDGLVKGIDITLKQVLSLLRKFNVKPVDAVGNEFDPRYHEAFLQEESADHPENTVIRELQKGYTLHDRLLRPAVVAVSKAKESPDAEKDEKQKDK